MSDIFDEFIKLVNQVSISTDRQGRSELIRVATDSDVQELFSNPDEFKIMQEIPDGMVMPLVGIKQPQKVLGEDISMEEILERYILDEASK